MKIDGSEGDEPQVWVLANDIEEEQNAAPKKKVKRSKSWEPLFISEGFFEPHD